MKTTDVAPVAAIKGNALDDGPGIRTVLFLKGCPLGCAWCHNPETRDSASELGFSPDQCLDDCVACLSVCELHALVRVPAITLDRDACTLCFACAEVCPAQVFEAVGTPHTVDQVMEILVRDQPFFASSGGGLTLSGGEPLQHPGFCTALARRCHDAGIPVLLQTAGLFAYSVLAGELLPLLDEIWFDLKMADDKEHRHWCQVSNRMIQENFGRLVQDARSAGVRLRARTPLVPGITATAENLTALARFLQECGQPELQLVPYNPLWPDKQRKLGKGNELLPFPGFDRWLSREEIAVCQQLVEGEGVRCTIG